MLKVLYKVVANALSAIALIFTGVGLMGIVESRMSDTEYEAWSNLVRR